MAASNDRTPGTRYVYDVKADKLTKLAEINPALAEADMAEVKPISYTARDGLTIRGYLTLPKGVPAKNLPVIVNRTAARGIATAGATTVKSSSSPIVVTLCCR